MAPTKKREKENTCCNLNPIETQSLCVVPETNKLNGHHQEQELFLQAFEKPTQIYRFLRNRHYTSPIFLNRTLSYMRDRMSRSRRVRPSFRVNSILEVMLDKDERLCKNFLNIVFIGLFNNNPRSENWWAPGDLVNVESLLYRITKNKRKDSTADFQEVLHHESLVVYNPDEDLGGEISFSIPLESLWPLGEQHSIYKLIFRVKTPSQCDIERRDDDTGDAIYGCELIVFEKNIGTIPEGDYESVVQELNPAAIKSYSPKKRTWESLPRDCDTLPENFDIFTQLPVLRFRLIWSTKRGASNDADDDMERKSDENDNHQGVNDYGLNNGSILQRSTRCERIQIVYNFLYNNNTRQQTEYTQQLCCPWCGLNCSRLYALLKHLKLCHGRFNFTYKPTSSGARIDVTINDSYDGSYGGSPFDLAGPSGSSFARTSGPVRRTPVTHLLVYRPRRQKTCLEEFLVLDEDDLNNSRPYITGHNRLYHHTETCLPVHPKELDVDSEGENDPLWLRQKTIQMIDEFSDVNEGEKELMKLWNLHVMKHGYVGDCQLPLACEMFLKIKGHEVIHKNLYRNFILHLSSLFDYGLISAETEYKIIQQLQGMLSTYVEGQRLMSQQHEEQLRYWREVGRDKQDEQKLKSPQKRAAATKESSDSNAEHDERDGAGGCSQYGRRPGKILKRDLSSYAMAAAAAAAVAAAAGAGGMTKCVAKKSAPMREESNYSPAIKEKRHSKDMDMRKQASVMSSSALPFGEMTAHTNGSGGNSSNDNANDNGNNNQNNNESRNTSTGKRRPSNNKDSASLQSSSKRLRVDTRLSANDNKKNITRSSTKQQQQQISNTATGTGSSSSKRLTTSSIRRQSSHDEDHKTASKRYEKTHNTKSSSSSPANLPRTRFSFPFAKIDKR